MNRDKGKSNILDSNSNVQIVGTILERANYNKIINNESSKLSLEKSNMKLILVK